MQQITGLESWLSWGMLRKISCVVHSRDTEKTDEKPLLWHQMTAVHSAIFKSLCDPACVTIKGNHMHWPVAVSGQAAKFVSEVCYSLSLFFFKCHLDQRNQKKITPVSFFIYLSVTNYSFHHYPPRGWEVPTADFVVSKRYFSSSVRARISPQRRSRMLVRRRWWKHLHRQAELMEIPIPSGLFLS